METVSEWGFIHVEEWEVVSIDNWSFPLKGQKAGIFPKKDPKLCPVLKIYLGVPETIILDLSQIFFQIEK